MKIRSAAVANRIPIMTTLSGAKASLNGIASVKSKGLRVKPIQEYQAEMKGRAYHGGAVRG